MRLRTGAAVLALAIFSMPAFAQEQTGAIQGTIKDAQGGVLPGVTVEAKNTATGAVQTTTTDPAGLYRFPALPPGRYELSANLSGFSPAKNGNVTLLLGQVLSIDLAMTVAGVAETVQVTGESPLIDVKQNASVAVVSNERIDRIPKGRDFTNVLAAVPGANLEARAGGVSVGGASGSENRFVVDGMDTTNLQNGSSGKTYVTDFIQEVQVKTAGYNAEYPGATGGVVNAITKSGTNTFHGSGGFYYRNNGPTGLGNKDKSNFWVGKQRPSLRLKPSNTTVAEYFTTPLDEQPVWEPVVEGGGPVFRDKLWYYAGYAPVRTHATRTVTWQTPVPGGPTTQTFRQNSPIDRLTLNGMWQISNSLRAKVGYNPQWSRSRHNLPGIEADGTSTSNAATDYASPGSNSWNNAYSSVVDWNLRPNLFVQISGGYFMYDTETLGNGTDIRHSMDGNISVFPNVPADLVQPSGYVDNRSTNKTVTDKQDRFYLNTTGTWYKRAFGEHAIKAGVRFERIGNVRDSGAIQPTITFHWDASYTTSTGEIVRGTYGYYDVSRGVLSVGDIHSDNWGLFIQDGWSPSSRLTINAGVRTESERIPFYTPGEENDGIKFGFGDKIAPRIGVAYDVRGDGKWKTYASFGRFFDITKLEMPRGSLGGEQWHVYYYPLNTLNWKSINCQEADPACPGLIEKSTLRFGSNEPDNPETAGVMTKYFGGKRNLLMDNMKPMTSQEFTVGLDHELSHSMSAGVSYQHKWVLHAIEDFGWNEGGTEFYFIGNPGEGYIGGLNFLWGQTNPATGFTPAPLYNPANTGGKVFQQVKPVRDYDSVEFRLTKRLSHRWSAEAIYQWSRLWGNYPGLASSDEAGSGNARLSPNVNRLYDGPWMMYDAHGNPVLGRLNTDRPHYLKVQPTYDFPWGTSIGATWYIRSGALFSKSLSYQGYSPVFFDGRGSLGRTPVEQALDVLVQHDFKLPGHRARLNVNLNVSNVFDNDVATSIYDTPFRDRFTFSPVETFFNGFDPIAIAAASSSIRPDARYFGGTAPARSLANFQNANPMNRIFLDRRLARFGMKITF